MASAAARPDAPHPRRGDRGTRPARPGRTASASDPAYQVAERHLRPVGKDCLVAFEVSLYSVPARRVKPREVVEVRTGHDTVAVHLLAPDMTGTTLLAVHRPAPVRGTWQVEPSHWDGLPDGHTRRTTAGGAPVRPMRTPETQTPGPLPDLINRTAAAQIPVGRRSLSVYDRAAGTDGRRRSSAHDTNEER